MTKIYDILNLFRIGFSVSDPVKWKQHQIEATVLVTLVGAIVKVMNSYGIQLEIPADDVLAMCAGIIAFVNVVLTVTTTEKIGLHPTDNSQEPISHDSPNRPPRDH